MTSKAPGKFYRQGISLIELSDMFPDETSAVTWFEHRRWPTTRYCGHCHSEHTNPVPNQKPMPYWCTSCRSYFSVKTGTILEQSRLPLRKWVIALYLFTTHLKSVSSMKLHRDLKVTQKTAWFMLHRIRQAWEQGTDVLIGPVEVEETYIGGLEKNRHASKKKRQGRGPANKQAVVGTRSRATNTIKAQVIDPVSATTLQRFVTTHTEPGTTVYSDQKPGYIGLKYKGFTHQSVNHKVSEFVNGMAHTKGLNRFGRY